jgi:hypothetical protein
VNEDLVGPVTGAASPVPDAESIQWRLVLPMVNEAARVLEEGVTDSTDTIDLATVLAWAWRPSAAGSCSSRILSAATKSSAGSTNWRQSTARGSGLRRCCAKRHGSTASIAPRAVEAGAQQRQQEHAVHT